ncbi:MAG: DUF4249 domain-containing protein [Cyclobacteriaceae bacterium]|nr:DUF4249 domain-containing protein [Cyclobacteriaceae bacterium]
MRAVNYIVGFVLAGLMAGCIPDPLPVTDIEKPETKIVVSSQLVPGTGLVVFVTKSVGALEAGGNSDPEVLLEKIAIADATVTLRHGTQSDVLNNLGNGLYGGFNTPWSSGDVYELTVETSTLGTVSAITQVPQAIGFTSVDVQFYPTGFDSLLQVDYSLNDPVGRNFYMVSVQKFSQKQNLQSIINPRIFTHLTDDTSFDGKLFEEDFRTLFRSFSKGDSVAVVMSNVSEDYYKFLKLRNDRFRFSEFSSEPFNYPTNVKGGYGFFNLHAPDIRVFVLE